MFSARHAMYATTYIHRVSRIAEAMLLKSSELSIKDLPDLTSYTDDELLARLMILARHPKSKELAGKVKYRDLFKEVYKIFRVGSTEEQHNLVKKISKIPKSEIESTLLKKTRLKQGDILVDFPADIVSEHRLTKTNIPILKKDGSIISLEEVSPIIKTLVQEESADSLFSVYSAKENKDKVKKAVENYLLQYR